MNTQMDILFWLLLSTCAIYKAWPRSQYKTGMLVNAYIAMNGQPSLQMLITRRRWKRIEVIKGAIERRYDGTVLKVQDGKIVVSTYIYGVSGDSLELIKGLE